MNTTTKMTLGILGGIGAGFCLGLLMSPDKGSNNRRRLVKGASDWADRLTHVFSHDGHDHQENLKLGRANATTPAKHRTQPKRKS